MITTQELLWTCVVGFPVAFVLGRLSKRVTWFHATAEEKYSVSEFLRSRD